MTAPPDELQTTDLGLAAYLHLHGYPVVALRGRLGKRIFVFPAEASEAGRAYFSDATVNARAFAGALRSVKRNLSMRTRQPGSAFRGGAPPWSLGRIVSPSAFVVLREIRHSNSCLQPELAG
jgi:hypothetical protein